MDFTQGISAAIALAYLLLGGGFLALGLIRKSDREYLPAGVVALVLAGAFVAHVVGQREGTPFAIDVACRLTHVTLMITAGATTELATSYLRIERTRLRTLVRGAVVVGSIVALVGSQLVVGILLYTGAAFMLADLGYALARSYLGGRKEALALVVGASLVAAAVLHDLFVSLHVIPGTYVIGAGYLVFLFAVASTVGIRYVALGRAFDERSIALQKSSHELRRSYEELRVAQEELVRKEQLAVVGELAAVIAHEVRNPLAILANAVSGLRKAALSREDHATLLTIMDEETSRLNRLVTDLLRYARPVSVERTLLSLRDLLERSLHLNESGGAWKVHDGVNVTFDAGDSDCRVWGDPNLLRQVFDNLIDNALQAMGSEGALLVRVRQATLDGEPALSVDVVDTGEGMDTSVRSRAKDPFFTTRPSGTGLGLAIVDRIVDAHGGQFVIESRTGEGTTARVVLPLGTSDPPPPHNSSRAEALAPSKSTKSLGAMLGPGIDETTTSRQNREKRDKKIEFTGSK